MMGQDVPSGWVIGTIALARNLCDVKPYLMAET